MSDTHSSPHYQFVATVSGKGGVGKSLLAQTAIELLILNQWSVETWQLDNQKRLEKTIGQSVKSLNVQTLKSSRKDPTVITKVFDPLFSGLEALSKTDDALLLDIGATQVGNFHDYAGLIDLDEELRLMGIRSLALVPCVAEPEAIRQAAKTMRLFEEVLPSFDLVLINNLRDGEITNLSTVSQAGQIFETELLPFLDRIPQITMPLIEAGSWRVFEQNHCRFLEVGMMEIDEIRAMTGLTRPEAKLARGDVLAFFARMEEELTPLFGFGEE